MQSANDRDQSITGGLKRPDPEISKANTTPPANDAVPSRVCPVCGGPLIEIRAKLQCHRCHTIVETCCEGGPP